MWQTVSLSTRELHLLRTQGIINIEFGPSASGMVDTGRMLIILLYNSQYPIPTGYSLFAVPGRDEMHPDFREELIHHCCA